MNSTRDEFTHGLHQMVNTKIKLITFFYSQRWRSCMQSAKTRPGADCGSAHQLLIEKFRLKLKKVWKTTRRARCDWNPIPYEYAVEVTNRFKGWDAVNSAPEELWMQVHNTVQFGSVQSLSRVWLFATAWTTACHASLSITNSQSPPKLMSIV